MRTILFIACSLTIVCEVSAQTFKTESFYDNGQLEYQGLYDHDLNIKLGKWYFYYPNGQLKRRSHYNRSGERHGAHICFYDTGKLKEQGRFHQDRVHGKWKTYHSNGKLRSQGRYVKGKREGVWKAYRPSGETHNTARYKEGQKVE